MIVKATRKDIPALERIILEEFPYTKFTKETIEGRLHNPAIIIFKKINRDKIIGFIEVQIAKHDAMINAISVEQKERRKGHGKELLAHALDFLHQKGVVHANLLVKKENTAAKKIYKKAGFGFSGFHERKIDGSVVEVWQKTLDTLAEQYLN